MCCLLREFSVYGCFFLYLCIFYLFIYLFQKWEKCNGKLVSPPHQFIIGSTVFCIKIVPFFFLGRITIGNITIGIDAVIHIMIRTDSLSHLIQGVWCHLHIQTVSFSLGTCCVHFDIIKTHQYVKATASNTCDMDLQSYLKHDCHSQYYQYWQYRYTTSHCGIACPFKNHIYSTTL